MNIKNRTETWYYTDYYGLWDELWVYSSDYAAHGICGDIDGLEVMFEDNEYCTRPFDYSIPFVRVSREMEKEELPDGDTPIPTDSYGWDDANTIGQQQEQYDALLFYCNSVEWDDPLQDVSPVARASNSIRDSFYDRVLDRYDALPRTGDGSYESPWENLYWACVQVSQLPSDIPVCISVSGTQNYSVVCYPGVGVSTSRSGYILPTHTNDDAYKFGYHNLEGLWLFYALRKSPRWWLFQARAWQLQLTPKNALYLHGVGGQCCFAGVQSNNVKHAALSITGAEVLNSNVCCINLLDVARVHNCTLRGSLRQCGCTWVSRTNFTVDCCVAEEDGSEPGYSTDEWIPVQYWRSSSASCSALEKDVTITYDYDREYTADSYGKVTFSGLVGGTVRGSVLDIKNYPSFKSHSPSYTIEGHGVMQSCLIKTAPLILSALADPSIRVDVNLYPGSINVVVDLNIKIDTDFVNTYYDCDPHRDTFSARLDTDSFWYSVLDSKENLKNKNTFQCPLSYTVHTGYVGAYGFVGYEMGVSSTYIVDNQLSSEYTTFRLSSC